MEGFPKYEKYKDSGVEWIGKAPFHWDLFRVKRIFKEVSEKNNPDLQLLSVTQNQGVIPRDMLEQRVVMPIGQLQTFKIVRSDDFVISLRSFQGGIEHSEYEGLVSPAYTVLRKRRKIFSGYLKHLLKSNGAIFELNRNTTGIRQGKNIDFKDFSFSFLPVPSENEQRRIASFLDQKTAEIDEAIEKKQQLIELLKEQRAVLINQAVTKGLDPNVPMLDSGVEWIGEIPTHWNVKRLKYFSEVQSGITLGKVYAGNSLSEYPYLRVANVQFGSLQLDDVATIRMPERESKNYFLKIGDILVTEGGDIDKLGRGTVWAGEINDCLHQNHIFAIRIDGKIASEYYVSMALSCEYGRNYFTKTANKTTNLASTNRTKLGNFPVVLPPLSEQTRIVKKINEIENQYGEIIGVTSMALNRLSEIKDVIISNAVTGKIKI